MSETREAEVVRGMMLSPGSLWIPERGEKRRIEDQMELKEGLEQQEGRYDAPIPLETRRKEENEVSKAE